VRSSCDGLLRYVGMDGLYAHADLTGAIIAAAIAVHRQLGPGLLESTYRTSLIREMADRGLATRAEAPIPIQYGDRKIDAAYRADLIVEDTVLVELKAVDKILPIHEAQTLTYLKHSKLRIGLRALQRKQKEDERTGGGIEVRVSRVPILSIAFCDLSGSVSSVFTSVSPVFQL